MHRMGHAVLAVSLGLAVASCSKNEVDRTAATGDSTAAASAAAAMTPVQRGEYLATVSGCHDCHTPGGLYGAPDMSRALSGSELGWKGPWGVSYAPNLTPDSTGLASWTDEQILNALQKGVDDEGAPLLPPMPWPAFAHYTPEDARAIVAYLRSLQPIHHVSPERVPPGGKATGAILSIPPAPAWDKPQKAAS